MMKRADLGSIQARLVIPVLLGAVLAAHGGALRDGFLYDDYHLIAENPAVLTDAWGAIWTSADAASRDAQGRGFRPVTISSYALDHALGGGRPVVYHATQVAMHAAVVWLTYLVATALGLSPGSSAAGALMVALHPAQAEAVHYLSARSSVLSTLWLLVSFWAYVHWRNQAAGHRGWRIASLLALVAAVLSKESAAVGLVWFLIYERLLDGGAWSQIARRLSPHGAAVLVSVIPIAGALGAHGSGASVTTGVAAATGVSAVGRHLWAWVAPFEHDAIVPQPWVGWGEPHVWGAAVLIAASVLAVYGLRRRAPRAAWGLASGVVSLAPVLALPFMTNVALFQPHRGYQASVGFAVATAALASACVPMVAATARSAAARWWLAGAGWAVALAATAATIGADVRAGRMWRSEVGFWTAATERYPDEAAYHHSLGAARLRAGDLEGAERAFSNAERLDPGLPRVDFNLGLVYTKTGRYDDAVDSYRRAIERDPSDVKSLANLGALYERMGDPEGAARMYAAALAVDPGLAPIRRNLDRLQALRGHGGPAP